MLGSHSSLKLPGIWHEATAAGPPIYPGKTVQIPPGLLLVEHMRLGEQNPGIGQMPGTLRSPPGCLEFAQHGACPVTLAVLTCVVCTGHNPLKLALSRPNAPSLWESGQAPNTGTGSSVEALAL